MDQPSAIARNAQAHARTRATGCGSRCQKSKRPGTNFRSRFRANDRANRVKFKKAISVIPLFNWLPLFSLSLSGISPYKNLGMVTDDKTGFKIWAVDNVVYGPVELPTLVSWVKED